jgi:hypothetical protein
VGGGEGAREGLSKYCKARSTILQRAKRSVVFKMVR